MIAMGRYVDGMPLPNKRSADERDRPSGQPGSIGQLSVGLLQQS
jgi:hypothetical protein